MSYGASAYAKVSRSALSPREAEAAVLIKAAGKLNALRDGTFDSPAALNEALMFNQRVWTLLAGAVADPANPLPDDLRRSVTELAVFVFRSIIDTMITPTSKKIEMLVSLNHHLAAGLQGDPGPARS